MTMFEVGRWMIFGAVFFATIFCIVVSAGSLVIFAKGMIDSREAWYLLLRHAARAGGAAAVVMSLIGLLPWPRKRS